MPLLKAPHLPPRAPLPWILPSLFAAFNVALLLIFSGLFFAFPCRWLAQNGEWAFPLVTGLLCVLTVFSLVSLNFSDPGILHQGSNEQGPTMVHVVWVNHRAFRLQWCQKCCFHCPPRTYHCPWCNICVEVHGRSCLAAEDGGVRLGAQAEPARATVPLGAPSPSPPRARAWPPGPTSGSLQARDGSPREW